MWINALALFALCLLVDYYRSRRRRRREAAPFIVHSTRSIPPET
jgi:hypothetical protein